MLVKYGLNCRLLFTDTDSFCYSIQTKDLYDVMTAFLNHLDTSWYPQNHPLYTSLNAKVLGKLKDECNGMAPLEFVGLRSKMYSLLASRRHTKMTANGIKKFYFQNTWPTKCFYTLYKIKHTTTYSTTRPWQGRWNKSQLTLALYYRGHADRIDSVAFDANSNSGLKTRKTFTTRSNPIDMMGRIHADLFFQSRYQLNEVNVKIKLTRYTDAFCTMSPAANASKVHILSAIMYVRKVKLSPSVFLAHARCWKIPQQSICKSRGVQDLDDSECGDGCESRETVLRTDSHAHRHRPGA